MNLNTRSGGLPELVKAWTTLQSKVELRLIRNDADLVRMTKLADELADEIGDDERHPLYSLFEMLLQLIEDWEEDNVHIPKSNPREVLRYLLEEHGLKQKDLSDIASQTLVSDILGGRREISKRLAKALSTRFNVNISLFI